MNILYIEDNADDAKLVARFIDTTGHHLVTVENLEEAYAVLGHCSEQEAKRLSVRFRFTGK